jgi:hypothetical protein
MPNKIKFGTAGGLGFEGNDSAENFDAPANVLTVSYICLGAGGGGGPSGGGDPSGGGGGGGGLSRGTLQVDPFDTIRVRAGGGGQGSTSTGSGSVSGTDGQDSFVRTSYGERNGRGGNGGETFNGGTGGNGNVRDGQNGENPSPFIFPNQPVCRGGGAAGLTAVAGRGSTAGAGGNGVNFVFTPTTTGSPVIFSATVQQGQTTITLTPFNSNLIVGMVVTSQTPSITLPANTKILSINASNSTIVLSAAPTGNGSGTFQAVNQTVAFTTPVVNSSGTNGANYGGGGGGSVDKIEIDFGGGDQAPVSNLVNISRPGGGGGGIAFVGWVTLTAPKTIYRSGEPILIAYNDSLNSTGTVQTSFVNETQSNIQQEYVYTDSLGAQARIIFTILPKVRIDSLIASPNPQTSGQDGIPNFDTFLIWEGISVLSAVATRSDGAVSATWEQKPQPTDPTLPPVFYSFGSKKVENLFQSVSTGSSQPGSTTVYTLTATDGFNTVTATVSVKAFNDNCPDNFTIPNQLNKEPEQELFISTSPITGIDMVTSVVCSAGLTVLSTQGGGYTTSTFITSGSSLNLRVVTEPFNTDENGLVNEKTVSVTVGCLTVSFLVQTRAPVVKEIFDFGDNQFAYPFPKIDTRVVGEPLSTGGTYQEPQPFLQSPTIVEPTADAWEVELESPFGVQIKAKDIKFSPQNTLAFNDISSQNDTKLEVNNRRQGEQPNNTWTKPNISNL